jgi:hypothetical protein
MASKQQELGYVETFLRLNPELGVASVEPSESPDFLVRRGCDIVGIEVTHFSSETWESNNESQVQQSRRRRMLSEAERQYSLLGGPSLEVHVTFSTDHLLVRDRVNEVADYLARFVQTSYPMLGMGYTRSPWRTDLQNDGFPVEIASISALPARSEVDAGWLTSQPIWFAHVDIDAVQHVVSKKESRVETYLKQCSEAWLLIVFPHLGAEFELRFPAELPPLSRPTRFARVFCVDPLRERSVEAPVTLPAA